MATSNGSTAIRDKILASLARYRALRIGKFPCAFWRLSARPGLTADAVAKDKAAQKEHVLNGHKKEFIDAEYKLNSEQTPSLK
ncbi:hypothetical protein [Bathymodiolus platifrons methanotrophic gill symbiont]|uniref:hypothetical protein n=1 Tax=Bathymodiolus platifrons methanotrophic gill symbiont TaxID=113268 RepID=UPI000B4215BE|nr:hypothetical protein [Bathymodiolus platifrons methanotrophic gill symbiont]